MKFEFTEKELRDLLVQVLDIEPNDPRIDEAIANRTRLVGDEIDIRPHPVQLEHYRRGDALHAASRIIAAIIRQGGFKAHSGLTTDPIDRQNARDSTIDLARYFEGYIQEG